METSVRRPLLQPCTYLPCGRAHVGGKYVRDPSSRAWGVHRASTCAFSKQLKRHPWRVRSHTESCVTPTRFMEWLQVRLLGARSGLMGIELQRQRRSMQMLLSLVGIIDSIKALQFCE